MSSARSDIVDVTMEYRRESSSGLATAFWSGEYEIDDRSCQKKEKWIWLPKSKVEIERKSGAVCEVSMPEWLAMDKGLI